MLSMKKRISITRHVFRYQRLILASVFSFLFGSLVTVNFAQINKTCKLDDTDRENSIMKNSKLKSDELVVLIFSSPDNLSKRNAIRSTWLKFQQLEVSLYTYTHYFVIGKPSRNSKKYDHIVEEQSFYKDILLLPMYDGYNNLSEKVLQSFVWLKEQRDFGFNFKYVLKCDDDSFVRVCDILHEISGIENFYLNTNVKLRDSNNDSFSQFLSANLQINKNVNNKKQFNLYWGYFTGKNKLKRSGKWKEDEWMLCDYYLPYALGGGYMLSADLVLYIANNADVLRQYNSEDVSVGTWLAPVTNTIRIHDIRFDTEWISRGCQNYYLITHHVSEKQMHEFYYNILTTGHLCTSESLVRMPYLYNWKKTPSECCMKTEKKGNLLDNIISLFPVHN